MDKTNTSRWIFHLVVQEFNIPNSSTNFSLLWREVSIFEVISTSLLYMVTYNLKMFNFDKTAISTVYDSI